MLLAKIIRVCQFFTNKLDVNDYSFAHLTLIHLVKCRSRRFAVYNNEFIMGRACIGSKWSQNRWDIIITYYRDVGFSQMLLPDIRAASGSEFFVFQQDKILSLTDSAENLLYSAM